jgi:hypothetical protein
VTIPGDPEPTVIDPATEETLARVVELLEEVAGALAQIEERHERTNELLDRIDRTQWS